MPNNFDREKSSELNFSWNCTGGTITPESDPLKASWRAPMNLGMATVSVRIENQDGLGGTANLPILIGIETPSQIIKDNLQIVERSPAAGAVDAQLSAKIVVIFNHALQAASLNEESFVVSFSEKPVSGELGVDQKIVTFTPEKPFEEGKTYKVSCTTAIRNEFGIPLKESESWSFTTIATAPVIVSKTPAADAVDVALDTTIVVEFSKALKEDSITADSFAVTVDGAAVAGDRVLSEDGKTVTFTPLTVFVEGKTCNISVTEAIKAVNGTDLAAGENWSFTTIAPAPEIASKNPAADATDVTLDSTIVVEFSKALKEDSITADSFAVTVDGAAVAGDRVLSEDGKTVTFTPSTVFVEGKTCNISVTEAIKAVNGTDLAAGENWSFTTIAPAPEIASKNPAADATDVALDTTIVVEFSKALKEDSITADSFAVTVDGVAVAGDRVLSEDGKTVIFTPSTAFAEGKTCNVSITETVKAVNGTALAAAENWSFTTIAPAPVIVSKTPAADATDVALDTTIVVEFSKAMNTDSITADSFAVTVDGAAVAGNIAFSEDGKTVIFTPSTAFAEGKTCNVSITETVKAVNGTALAAAENWSFTTIAPAPVIVSKTPAADATDVALDSTIVVEFSKVLKSDSVTADSFAVTVDGAAVAGNIAFSEDGKTVIFAPSTAFAEGKTCNVSITETVKAVNGTALAAGENWSFTTASRPSVPANLVASEQTPSSFKVAWGEVAKADSYKVYLDGKFYQNVTDATLLNIDGRAAMTTYEVQVSAVNEIGESAKSEILAVTTTPEPEFRIYTHYDDSVGIKDDGSLVAWGDNSSSVPTDGKYRMVGGDKMGLYALRTDGTIVSWGGSGYQPSGSGYESFSSQGYEGMAIKDGALVEFGGTNYGLPADNSGFKQVSVGSVGYDGRDGYYIALKTDGSVVGGGDNTYYQAVSKTGPYKFIAAGKECSFALKASDGSIDAWGKSYWGDPLPTDSGYKQISVALEYGIALKDDGTLAKWGSDTYVRNGEKPVNKPDNPFIGVAATQNTRALLLRQDGTVIHWGNNTSNLGTPPEGPVDLK